MPGGCWACAGSCRRSKGHLRCACHRTAQALLGVPKILAENSGYDPQDCIIALQVGGWMGGAVFSGTSTQARGLQDCLQACIIALQVGGRAVAGRRTRGRAARRPRRAHGRASRPGAALRMRAPPCPWRNAALFAIPTHHAGGARARRRRVRGAGRGQRRARGPAPVGRAGQLLRQAPDPAEVGRGLDGWWLDGCWTAAAPSARSCRGASLRCLRPACIECSMPRCSRGCWTAAAPSARSCRGPRVRYPCPYSTITACRATRWSPLPSPH